MFFTKPRTIASLIGFFTASIFGVFYLLYSRLQHINPWILIPLISLTLFYSTYFSYRYFVEKFIYEKIKLIYKVINTLKTPKKEFLILQNNNLLEETEKAVLQWAEDKKEEIEQLTKSEIYRREFVGNVSHELKTPIFNMQGYISTLLDGGMDDLTINKEYLVRAENNINRMIAIVEDLETISQLESGQLKLNIERFDIVILAKEVIESLEIKAKRKKIKILFDKEYPLPINVMADRERIRQVLVNLTDNSIKYNNENGVTKIEFHDMDENILVDVSDNGIGISSEHISRIFERFYRIDKSRSREQGGSGLGLAIVKHIIEAHNQTINVNSTIGSGTTFAFTISKN